MLRKAARLPETTLSAPRDALFGSISGTFDHTFVVAEIFRAHLEGRAQPHQARQRNTPLDCPQVASRLSVMNAHFVGLSRRWTNAELIETIPFKFVDGGHGAMTSEDILLHLANHSTYQRGFVSKLMYPHKTKSSSSDLTVFLRDVWPNIATHIQEGKL